MLEDDSLTAYKSKKTGNIKSHFSEKRISIDNEYKQRLADTYEAEAREISLLEETLGFVSTKTIVEELAMPNQEEKPEVIAAALSSSAGAAFAASKLYGERKARLSDEGQKIFEIVASSPGYVNGGTIKDYCLKNHISFKTKDDVLKQLVKEGYIISSGKTKGRYYTTIGTALKESETPVEQLTEKPEIKEAKTEEQVSSDILKIVDIVYFLQKKGIKVNTSTVIDKVGINRNKTQKRLDIAVEKGLLQKDSTGNHITYSIDQSYINRLPESEKESASKLVEEESKISSDAPDKLSEILGVVLSSNMKNERTGFGKIEALTNLGGNTVNNYLKKAIEQGLVEKEGKAHSRKADYIVTNKFVDSLPEADRDAVRKVIEAYKNKTNADNEKLVSKRLEQTSSRPNKASNTLKGVLDAVLDSNIKNEITRLSTVVESTNLCGTSVSNYLKKAIEQGLVEKEGKAHNANACYTVTEKFIGTLQESQRDTVRKALESKKSKITPGLEEITEQEGLAPESAKDPKLLEKQPSERLNYILNTVLDSNKKGEKIKLGALIKSSKLSRQTVCNYLNQALNEGLVEKEGGDTHGNNKSYVVTNKFANSLPEAERDAARKALLTVRTPEQIKADIREGLIKEIGGMNYTQLREAGKLGAYQRAYHSGNLDVVGKKARELKKHEKSAEDVTSKDYTPITKAVEAPKAEIPSRLEKVVDNKLVINEDIDENGFKVVGDELKLRFGNVNLMLIMTRLNSLNNENASTSISDLELFDNRLNIELQKSANLSELSRTRFAIKTFMESKLGENWVVSIDRTFNSAIEDPENDYVNKNTAGIKIMRKDHSDAQKIWAEAEKQRKRKEREQLTAKRGHKK